MSSREVTVITGGASGIGRAVALYFLKKGCHVVVLDNDQNACESADQIFREICRQTPAEAVCLTCDISNEEQIIVSIEKIIQLYGRIDTLINNAAVSASRRFDELSLEEWNRVLAVNLTGPFLCARHCAEHLKRTGGSIVNIASTRAVMSEPGSEAYSASKGGLVSLTHALAMSLAPEVRVNCISPGWIDTARYGEKEPEPLNERDHLQHPVGRIGNPLDIAAAAWFLADDESGFITGQNWVIDGGMTKKMIYE